MNKTQVILLPVWTIRRFKDERAYRKGNPDSVIDPVTGLLLPAEIVIPGNVALDEGMTALQNLLIGAAETAFNNANSYIGVGDSATAENATQTGLQASTNKLYKGMEAGYPSITTDTTTWRAVFGTSEANFAWNEFTVANGNSDAADNLNRKVSSQGTKATGVWTIDLAISFGN